jgi:radical SAM protein with 4Fe4S-binding SPASM domain
MKIYTIEDIGKLPRIDEDIHVGSVFQPRKYFSTLTMSFALQIHITDRCNLSCQHCYNANHKAVDMDFELFKEAIDDFISLARIFRMNALILITGGEPTIHKNFFQMLDYLDQKMDEGFPIDVRILTNAISIDRIMAENISKSRSVSEIQVSIDGPKEIHDIIRGSGNYEKTIRTIELLKELEINVAMSCVISKINYKYAKEIVHVAVQNNIRRLNISRFVPIMGEGEQNQIDKVLSIEQLKDTWDILYREASILVENIVKGKSETYLNMQRCDMWHLADEEHAMAQWMIPDSPRYLLQGLRCMVGVNILALLPNGDIYPCRRLPIKLGNLREDKLKSLWMNNPFLKEYRNRESNMLGKCNDCIFFKDKKYKMLCNGGGTCMSFALGKTIYDPDPQCWKEV